MTRQSTNRRAIWSWALYDFANSPFTTLVVTFIYAAYFTQSMVDDEIRGTGLWTLAVSVTAIIVAFLSPLMGAVADRGGFRKTFLVLFTLTCVVATIRLYGIPPGAEGSSNAIRALIWFVIANIAFEMGCVFYNAFLPDVAPSDQIGRVSGYGWSMGYLGGLLALVLALVGFIQPAVPWFGFSTGAGENVRATNLLVAIWFATFSIPIVLWVHEDKSRVTRTRGVIAASYRQLVDTLGAIRKYKQVVWFLLARLLYNDGLVTVFAFGGIYAAGTFDFTIEEILIFGIVLNITAGVGAFVCGFLDDALGGKRTIQLSLVGLIVATLLAILAPSRTWFWVAGIVIGIFSGPNQSASRSLMGRFVPANKENEFFGFFAFSGKATGFLGPFLLGRLTEAFDSQRIGVSIVLVLFVAGALVLIRVDEKEGIAVAAVDKVVVN
jgi:MFS transporter, UMF1 family